MTLLNDPSVERQRSREMYRKMLMRDRDKRITLYIPEQLHSAVKEKCARQKATMTDVLNKLLYSYIRKEEAARVKK